MQIRRQEIVIELKEILVILNMYENQLKKLIVNLYFRFCLIEVNN